MKTSSLLLIFLALLAGSHAARGQDVLTGGYGNERTNADLNETILTPASMGASPFGKLFSLPVDGQIYAQPLYRRQIVIPGNGTHNVVFVATMHNSVYAFDADLPGAPLWTVNLGPSVPAGSYTSDFGPYTDITVENGILGTPVIDPRTGTLYVVAATLKNGTYLYRLHALDDTNGAERAGSPVAIAANIAGTGDSSQNGIVPFVARQHLQRPALLLANDAIYIGFGAHGDAAPWHGWILAYSTNLSGPPKIFNTTPDGRGGSFWQGGRGLTADASGAVYGVASNGDTDGVTNFSDSVLKLNANLSVTDWFAPSDVQDLNHSDEDLGSMGAILIPGSNYLLTGGKEGIVYLMDRNTMGHQTSSDSQIGQTLNVTSFGNFNAALWPRPDGPLLYTHGADEPVRSWRFDGSRFATTPASEATNTFNVMFQGMTVSANGGQSGSGILWVLQPQGYDIPAEAELVAYDAEDLTKVLWDSAASVADDPGVFTKFANPTVADGKVFVPTSSNALIVYGQGGGDTPTAPVVTSVSNAASYSGQIVAPGEILAISGMNLGPASLVGAAFDKNGALPTSLAGSQVTFNGIPVPLLYTSSIAVAVVAPFGLTPGSSVVVQASYEGQMADPQTLTVADAAPGIFSTDASGSGPAVILNPDYSVNSPLNPATAGSAVAVYATGGGKISGSSDGGLASTALPDDWPVTASVNGAPVQVLYAGAAPGMVYGTMQVNLMLPQGLTGDCPVVLTVKGQASQGSVTVSVQ